MAEKNDLASLASTIQAVASPFRSYLGDLYEKYRFTREGKVADSIPELALADPSWFGICVMANTGQIFEVGECDRTFTVQAISTALVFGLALEEHGRDRVSAKVSVEPTGETANTILLDEKTHRPHNPIIHAGAIATTDLITGKNATERLKRILEMFQGYTGHEHDINVPVFLSAKATGNRNRAMAYFLRHFGTIGHKIEETLDLYFQQCSILVNARDLAVIAATLANGGVNPLTGTRAIDERYVRDVIGILLSCGMYDTSGEWAYRVGLPATTGVGGGLLALAPGKLGIGTFSPPLDEKGHSARGLKVCHEISRDFGLHLFNVAKPDRDLQTWLEGGETIDPW